MREILFRGKRPIKGEWVEGYFVHCKSVYDDESERIPEIITIDADRLYKGEYGSFDVYKVILETVGQFTGLTDKNGKRIFEGDILKRTNGNKYVWYVDYKNCAFCANQSNCNYACELGELLDQIELEVIGNIHDNPELLEG